MNLASAALAAALAVSPTAADTPAREGLEYALPAPTAPCFTAPCGGVLVSDFGLDLGEPGGPRAGEVRLLLADRLYLGTRIDADSRTLALTTARWDLALDHRDHSSGLEAEYRAPRFRLRARAEDHDPDGGDGHRLDAEVAVRLGPELELFVGALDDGREGFSLDSGRRPTSEIALGALWQHGARFELGARMVAATLTTPGGFELDRRGIEVDTTYQAKRWLLAGGLAFDDLAGRFDRRELTADLRFDYRLFRHLVAHTEASERYEVDLGSLERELGAGVTYYARRFRFARGGAAARDTATLTRRAYELGFNERRAHDLEGRRALRQRLALAGARDELMPLLERLHQAQIDERNVPVAGVFWRRDRDSLDGSRLRQREIFVAIPWPRRDGPHPLRPDEAATDFLRLSWITSERQISTGFSTEGSILAIDVSLRRDLGLRFEWSDPPGTGLQFALQSQEPRQFTARVSYRLGI